MSKLKIHAKNNNNNEKVKQNRRTERTEMAYELALFRSRTCYRCAFICSFSKFSGHRKSHASSNKATLHAWLFLAYNLSTISLSHLQPLLLLPPTTHCPPLLRIISVSHPYTVKFFVRRHCTSFTPV